MTPIQTDIFNIHIWDLTIVFYICTSTLSAKMIAIEIQKAIEIKFIISLIQICTWCWLMQIEFSRKRKEIGLGLLQRGKIYLVRQPWHSGGLVTNITLTVKYVITVRNILLSSPPSDHPASLPLGISNVWYRICWLELFWRLNFDSL